MHASVRPTPAWGEVLVWFAVLRAERTMMGGDQDHVSGHEYAISTESKRWEHEITTSKQNF